MKNITIIGAGKSGIAAALLAKRKGYNVFLSESGEAKKFSKAIEILDYSQIKYEFGSNTEKALEDVDFIITSPGVLPSSWVLSKADKRKIRIISELEFASWFLENKLVAITGTNGKTTTTSMLTYIFNHSGKKAVAAGNIGTPLSDLVDNIDADTIIVAEVSSFQLDRIETFRPDIAIILNITPDHLYYHGTFDNYQHSKWKIFSNQIEKDLLILNKDDAATVGGAVQSRGNVVYFSMTECETGIFKNNGKMIVRYPSLKNEEVIMLFEEVRLPGIHNEYNSMAAALAARALEVRNEDIRDSLMSFAGVEHRLEYVRTINNVDFINDSKATNVNATWYALSSYKQPIVWIAGGRGDSNNYSELDSVVKENVKTIICIGEESDYIFNHFCTFVRCIKCNSLDEAVKQSLNLAHRGDVVLFAPACKSFDMFFNFEHRGEVFKQIVNNL